MRKPEEMLSQIVHRISELVKSNGVIWLYYSNSKSQNANELSNLLSEIWLPIAIVPEGVLLDKNRKSVLRSLVVNVRKEDIAFFLIDQANIIPLLEVIPDKLKKNIILVTDEKKDGFQCFPLQLLETFAEEESRRKYHKELNYLPVWYYRMIRNEVPYRTMIYTLIENIPPIHTAIDLGCGIGLSICPLEEKGIDVIGYDYAAEVLKGVTKDLSDKIVFADLTKSLDVDNMFDLAICIEVAEHLPPESSSTLIENLDETNARYLLFSAAPPGQGGTGHINERKSEYWDKKLEEKGFIPNHDVTLIVSKALAVYSDLVPWLSENIKVYFRK